MKDFFRDVFNKDSAATIFIALLLGLLLGVLYNTPYSIGIRTKIHNIVHKFNPEKDSKSIIIEKATKDISPLPQKSIFEEPQKENRFILFIKRVFTNKQEQTKTINDEF
jgi:hypothetical protein